MCQRAGMSAHVSFEAAGRLMNEGRSQHRRARALPAVWRGFSGPKGAATDVIFSSDDQKVMGKKGGGVLIFGDATS